MLTKLKHIKFNGDGEEQIDYSLVHFEGVQGIDYTLCGLSMDGDDLTFGSYTVVKDKVNCKNCIDIIEQCKGISKSEYK